MSALCSNVISLMDFLAAVILLAYIVGLLLKLSLNTLTVTY